MKHLLVLFCLIAISCPAVSSAAAKDAGNEGPRVYMPYARSRDHMVVGVEIPGYHMRYDIAQKANIFMILLPDGFDDMERTPVYFSIDTFALGNHTVKETFANDLAALAKENPGLKILGTFDGSKLPKAGECYGAEFRYRDSRPFPCEVFYFCRNSSRKYAIMLSIGARDKKSLQRHLPDFITWANGPQIVTDQKIVEFPAN